MQRPYALLLFLFPFAGLAQPSPDPSLSRTIDREVWTPFKAAYAAYDAEAFNALHTEDVLRGGPWGLRIGRDYKQANREQMSRPNLPRRTIDLRFEHRLAQAGHAYEVGIYRVMRFPEDGEPVTFFGQFHVRLIEESGTWKIAQDWDASEVLGRPVTEADFNRLPVQE